MSEIDVPPEDPQTAPDEMLPEDSTPGERARDASDHAGRTAREEAREREDD